MTQLNTEGPLVIAIDSSTTSTKTIVVDIRGNVLAIARENIQMHTPAMDFYEHNPIRWWETTRDSMKKVLSKISSKDKQRIEAIGITHQRESFAPFDIDGKPLRNGILWLDCRSSKQATEFGSVHIHELSGRPPGVTPGLYKMIWLKENEPNSLKNAHKIVDVHCYIAWNLTGRWASSSASADSLGLFDIQKLQYSDELLDLAGVRLDQMSELVPPGEVIGMLKKDLVSYFGLPKSIPIVAGCGDGQAAGIGAAAVTPDVGFLNLGTAVNAGVESSEYKFDPVYRTDVSGIKGNYVLEVIQSSGSYLAGWFRQALGDPKLYGEPDPLLDEEASKIPPGCEGLVTLPYWISVQSPYWDPFSRGAVVGWRGTHSRAHMYRSILESIGYEMKLNLESIEKNTGVKLQSLRAMGGGTRSRLWLQIMADIVGIPITVCSEAEISALGAAILALTSIKALGTSDVKTVAKEVAHFGETIEPDMIKKQQYDEVGAIQRKLYPRLKDIFEDLYKLANKYPGLKPESPKIN